MAVAVGDTAPEAAVGGCDVLHDAVQSIPFAGSAISEPLSQRGQGVYALLASQPTIIVSFVVF